MKISRIVRSAVTAAIVPIAIAVGASGAFAQQSFPGQNPEITGPKAAKEKRKVPYHKSIKELPKTPEERRRVLSNLYALLATAHDEKTAGEIANTIQALWHHSGSDTVTLLLERSNVAARHKDYRLARELLDAAVELAPDYAEAWARRAFVHYLQDDYARALGDLRRALALEPNHFKALDGLGLVLRDVGQKKGALKAFRTLQQVHPFWPDIAQTIKELEEDVEGRGI